MSVKICKRKEIDASGKISANAEKLGGQGGWKVNQAKM